ncbi:MAG: type III PLP-dependent enzyme [Bdellovibrionales bacterium]
MTSLVRGVEPTTQDRVMPASVRDSVAGGLLRFATVEDMVKTLRPDQPVHCLHPEELARNADTFLQHFQGTTLFAVKSNPDPYILRLVYSRGVRHFDTASLAEIKLARGLFADAHLAFMHPIKSREAIRAAYFEYGVRDFAVDCFEELHKILEETNAAVDLGIHVRLTLPKGSAKLDLSTKFGATPDVAASLLQSADKVAHRVGLCFHVGSQSMDPQSYVEAIAVAGHVVRNSGVALDVFDVGGGFPASYPGMETVPLTDYFVVIREAVKGLGLPAACQVWCEPGRAMVASGGTLVARVELRKGDALYLNDGTYGSLFDAGWLKWTYPVRMIRPGLRARKSGMALLPYRFYGPTCDSLDAMPGPFMLPSDICEGDWIAIGQMGAYGASIQSHFNGFYSDQQALIGVDPLNLSVMNRRRRVRMSTSASDSTASETREQ